MTQKNTTFLVTGGGGYLGSVIVPMLLNHKYNVKVIDRFFWGKDIFAPYSSNNNLLLIQADTRSFKPGLLKNVDVVIDLAALSNDPIAELDPQKTLDINFHARVRTALLAKKAGVKKYILASSCSVYGFQENILDETSKTKPVTIYAKASLLAENETLKLSNKNFSVTALRQGTLYGISPRMRFDLVLNAMTLSLFQNNIIKVQGGKQWRPIVHVFDAAMAFVKTAKAPSEKINGQIFNVGSSNQNYQIKDLAQLITSTLYVKSKIIFDKTLKDTRSYQVSFEKIKKIGYKTQKKPRDGIKEIYLALKKKQITDSLQNKTLDWYKYLLNKDPKILDVKLD